MKPLSPDRNAREVAPAITARADVWPLRDGEMTADRQHAANDLWTRDVETLADASLASDDNFWTRVLRTVSAWRERSRERHALAHLSAWQRRDIGLPSETIDYEFNKHYWRA